MGYYAVTVTLASSSVVTQCHCQHFLWMVPLTTGLLIETAYLVLYNYLSLSCTELTPILKTGQLWVCSSSSNYMYQLIA